MRKREIARDLRKAAKLIEKDGKCEGHYHKNGAYCVIGAIAVARGKRFTGNKSAFFEGEEPSAMAKFERNDPVVAAARDNIDPCIIQWSDQTDVEEVIAKLREVAYTLDPKRPHRKAM